MQYGMSLRSICLSVTAVPQTELCVWRTQVCTLLRSFIREAAVRGYWRTTTSVMQSTASSESSLSVFFFSRRLSRQIGNRSPGQQFDLNHMPPASIRQYKAAAVQSEPGWFDLQRCIQMTVDLILEAGEKGCMLVAFPETCQHTLPIQSAD
jgi:hypothetical protein